MSESRFEVAQQDILNEFAQISIANGYRTDVASFNKALRDFDKIKQTEIGVVIPSGKITGIDGAWTAFDGFYDVIVQGAVFSDTTTTKDQTKLNTAILALEHDMLRVMAIIMTKYISGNPTRWNIMPKPIAVNTSVDFGDQDNKGIILIGFQVQIRFLDGTFV